MLSAMLCHAGCAKIGDPQPPEILIPEPARDLAARQLSDFVSLTVSQPQRNTNGSEVTTLRRVEILRLDTEDSQAAGSLPQDQFIKGAVRIFSIPASRFPEFLTNRAFAFQDRSLAQHPSAYSSTFWYAALFINHKNQSAGLSNRVAVKLLPIPPPPGGVSVEGRQNCIELKWMAPVENMDGSKPPRIAGYNIYRAEEVGKFPAMPLNPSPVTVTAFQDNDFRFGTTYYYFITTVGMLQQPYPESLPSTAAVISTKDTFPPEPPSEFSALFQGNEIILLWAPSPSPDVAGYRLLRREKGSAEYEPVQGDLIRGLNFRDTRVTLGKSYEFEILAVDLYGNASLPIKTGSEPR